MNKISLSGGLESIVRATLSGYHQLRRKPLKMCVGDRQLYFRSLGDFEFCVAPRIAVPSLRFNELFRRPITELRAEAATMCTLESALQGVLDHAHQHGISFTDTLANLGVRMISKDHDWRAIFIELVETQHVDDAYTRAALAAYLQYLAARQAVIQTLIVLRYDAAGDRFAPDKSTVIFADDELRLESPEHVLRRLPQGEAVMLRLENGADITIKLAKHRFSLSHRQGWSLLADNGKRYALRPGVNSVGRSRDNDIAVDAHLANVSRKHLLAQPVGADVIVLTDISSYGTYIPSAAIAS